MGDRRSNHVRHANADALAAPTAAAGGRGDEHEARGVRAATRRLRGRALSLGVANAFDYAMQFLLPVVLVRYLDAAAFGEYRLLWVAVGTILPLATLAMPGSLYYFLPRSDPVTK